jgi:hypothetical protein
MTHELVNRFDGVLRELLRSTRPHLSENEIQESITAIWLSANPSFRNLADHRRFSEVLWSAYVAEAETTENLLLKPKFMLRQFIEELSDGIERDTLLALAFDVREDRLSKHIGLTDQDKLSLLSNSYLMLHRKLLQMRELAIFTDNTITPEMLQGKDPIGQYHDWLFP